MRVTLRLNPEQAGFINCDKDVIVDANKEDTYSNLKYRLCGFCENLAGFIGEAHILFEKKDEEGKMKRLFNAMEISEDYREGEIIYWKCISPDFLSQNMITTKRKAEETPVVVEQPKKKSKLDEEKEKEELEYLNRRSSFMSRLGEKVDVKEKKIQTINTSSVWKLIKIEHNNETKERSILVPQYKLGILAPYFKRMHFSPKSISKNAMDIDNSDKLITIPVPNDLKRSDQDILDDLESFQVMRYNYEIWHDCLSSVTATGQQGTEYPFVYPATYIPLTQAHIESLLSAFTNKTSSPNLGNLIQHINNAIISEYGKLEKHQQKTFFPRLSTMSPKDIVTSDVSNKEMQVKSGEELVSLFLKSERLRQSLVSYQKFNDPEKKLYIILVEWQQFEKKGEFRCFVHKEKITAISQYHCYSNFGFTETDKRLILQSVETLWDGISLYLPYEDCVMDVYIDFSTDEHLASIIEFNPFGGDLTSGSALYNWETDKAILYNENVIEPDVRVVMVEGEMSEEDDGDASDSFDDIK
jgi:hypothetical protein